ncbi:MAG: transposase [Undibacterium sp.]|uniref:transposase n=1 Tax=Undibacterium sp. TaxID=1914977 RepID=UPI0027180E76|nr:transposase [Undibacterium sp.]MDO8653478.1 transposase [Undibacterium sp.]
MDLAHNQTIRISSSSEAESGVFRVILVERRIGQIVLVKIDNKDYVEKNRGGRRRLAVPKNPRKKASLPNVGDLIWAEIRELEILDSQGHIQNVDIEHESVYFKPMSKSDDERFASRLVAMRCFLEFDNLRDSIIAFKGLGELVKMAMKSSGLSRALIYRLWSLLCRFGFNERSLRPRRDRCGAPNILRPCDPNGRKKAGRKSTRERLLPENEKTNPLEQPGMNSVWRLQIMAADKKIPVPKPDFPARYIQIINSHFVKRYRQVNGELIPCELVKGEYPNRSQIRRVLNVEIPRMARLLEKTTKGHYLRSHRGLTASNWKGVAGPGHTWAIDSTIGDIYLRSSVNRAWIIGRPVVYLIVDVWSTAIVGFYVCLVGPSWDMAKISLFSAGADPNLIADLWSYQPILSLQPFPTLPVVLMCDRGEYLSRAASITGMRLIPCMSYAPPYRPDLKGLVEVLHRIEKDKQYLWVPGAIDARRREYELRRFDPTESVFTISEYTNFLHTIFAEYNLTADRVKRLDTHMIAAGVMPSPAGLWRWGHEVGIGTRRAFQQSQLITDLLPNAVAKVTRKGVRFAGLQYESDTVNEEQWTARARNLGSWDIGASYFPGSVSRIWTPNINGSGLLDLRLSQQTLASNEQTMDEVLDAFMVGKINKPEYEHLNVLQKIISRQRIDALIFNAKIQTEEAISKYRGAPPTMTESRQMEASINSKPGVEGIEEGNPRSEKTENESEQAYVEMMREVMLIANKGGA